MDGEFQWRNQMRKLDRAVEPARDLWPQIEARIATPATPRRQWRRPAFAIAIAASVLVVAGAAFTAVHLRHAEPALAQVALPTALDWAKPADPRLADAAQDLDKASADLQAALEARPDAVFLVGMLNRTNAQRMRLMRQSAISG
ncbi:MAG: hypothetical protein QM741_09310 [Rudaea sp.]|uniref:hypothetical protein n=1 Tax=Rudaea sp. TaxID=2136325 RepID=UPI0039E2F78E